MAIRNCLNQSIEQLRLDIKMFISILMAKLMISKRNCDNKDNYDDALGNFNDFTLMALKEVFDELKRLDDTGGLFNSSSPYKWLEDEIDTLMEKFNKQMCDGSAKAYTDLNNKYNSNNSSKTSIFPKNLTDAEKQSILEILHERGMYDPYNQNWDNEKLNGRGALIMKDYNNIAINTYTTNQENNNNTDSGSINSTLSDGSSDSISNLQLNNGSYLVIDNIFNGSDGINIPDKEIENINLTTSWYKCFGSKFSIDMYINTFSTKSLPIITEGKIKNLKKIHNDILLPIYRYYFGDPLDGKEEETCYLRIIAGLTLRPVAEQFLSGTQVSLHMKGMAVDFSLVGINKYTILKDVSEKKIPIEFGIIAPTNNIHITLPYIEDNYMVKGVVLSSTGANYTDIEMKFI